MKTVIVEGRPVRLTQAARQTGLAYSTLNSRLRKAADDRARDRALRAPPMSSSNAGRLGAARSPWRGQ